MRSSRTVGLLLQSVTPKTTWLLLLKSRRPIRNNREQKHLSWGLVPYSAYRKRSSLHPGLPRLARSARRVSRSLSGFLLL